MRVFIVSLSLLVPLAAQAEPMLLIEIVGPPSSYFPGVPINIGVKDSGPSWWNVTAPHSEPGPHSIPEPLLSQFPAHLTVADDFAEIWTDNNGVTSAFRTHQLFANGSIPSWYDVGGVHYSTVSSYVPKLGPGLSGYAITDITQQVHLVTINAQQFWVQTVKLYGDVVPEPAAWLLVLCGVFALMRWRR